MFLRRSASYIIAIECKRKLFFIMNKWKNKSLNIIYIFDRSPSIKHGVKRVNREKRLLIRTCSFTLSSGVFRKFIEIIAFSNLLTI